jgi:hypothetical protein
MLGFEPGALRIFRVGKSLILKGVVGANGFKRAGHC